MSANLFSLKGKTVVITGATRGIGEGMATGLAEAGANIILVHRGTTDPTEVVKKLQAVDDTIKVLTLSAELEKNEEVFKVLPESLKLSPTGKVDVLINNAGISLGAGKAEDYDDESWERVLQVNINAVFKLTRDFGKYWIEHNQKGKVINTGSLYSFIGGLSVVPYTASKHAIHGLTKALSNEWAGKGININTIVPGYIVTDMTERVRNDEARSSEILKRIPAGRWGDIYDFKGPTVFLSSEASDYVTGGSISVDGGFLAY